MNRTKMKNSEVQMNVIKYDGYTLESLKTTKMLGLVTSSTTLSYKRLFLVSLTGGAFKLLLPLQ